MVLDQLSSYNLLDWFELIGALIAFILFILKIIEYNYDKIRLSIDVKVKEFNNYKGSNMDEPYSELILLADIKNTGRQPTTISKVELKSDNDKFTDIELHNNKGRGEHGFWYSGFEPIRINPNDRIESKLFCTTGYLEDFKGLNLRLIFKTSHKDIIRELKIQSRKK